MTAPQVIARVVRCGVPVRGNDIDTDRIIPARYLREITFESLGPHAFEDDRQSQDGAHPMDDPRFSEASVLVVNRNFGCGSSREHAPQALYRRGIRSIVGESFGEIFFGNCTAIGLLCVTLPSDQVEAVQTLVEEDSTVVLTVDLETLRVETSGTASYSASIPEGVRGSFLTGRWDALGQLLENADAIRATSRKLPYLTGFMVND